MQARLNKGHQSAKPNNKRYCSLRIYNKAHKINISFESVERVAIEFTSGINSFEIDIKVNFSFYFAFEYAECRAKVQAYWYSIQIGGEFFFRCSNRATDTIFKFCMWDKGWFELNKRQAQSLTNNPISSAREGVPHAVWEEGIYIWLCFDFIKLALLLYFGLKTFQSFIFFPATTTTSMCEHWTHCKREFYFVCHFDHILWILYTLLARCAAPPCYMKILCENLIRFLLFYGCIAYYCACMWQKMFSSSGIYMKFECNMNETIA